MLHIKAVSPEIFEQWKGRTFHIFAGTDKVEIGVDGWGTCIVRDTISGDVIFRSSSEDLTVSFYLNHI